VAAVLLTLIASGCGGAAEPTPATAPAPSYAADWQGIVDDLRALQAAQELPADLVESDPPPDLPFDVSSYFRDVFSHIEPEPSFTLDYVYRLTPDRGFPVLYVRRVDAAPYESYEEYLEATGSGPVPQGDLAYLDQIYVIDGTPTGFFEYVVLRVMGGRFYLHWHARAADATVVATREAVDAALATVDGRIAEPEAAKARAADPTPEVTYGDGTVTVEVTVFTSSGGLQRRTYVFETIFPQRLLEETNETIAECDCAVTY
jgi:hypothetical protein